jgi:hypothetical protein
MLIITIMLQFGIVSRINLFSGTADLPLIFLASLGVLNDRKATWFWCGLAGMSISLISAMPYFVPFFAYLFVAGISQFLRKRMWETPILALFLVVFFGSVLQHQLYYIALLVDGTSISWVESLNMVTLPSILLNMLLAIPIYLLVHEISSLVKTERT